MVHRLLQTAEGTRFQLISQADRTHAVVVSTMMEAWEIVRQGLVEEGTVKDVSAHQREDEIPSSMLRKP